MSPGFALSTPPWIVFASAGTRIVLDLPLLVAVSSGALLFLELGTVPSAFLTVMDPNIPRPGDPWIEQKYS